MSDAVPLPSKRRKFSLYLIRGLSGPRFAKVSLHCSHSAKIIPFEIKPNSFENIAQVRGCHTFHCRRKCFGIESELLRSWLTGSDVLAENAVIDGNVINGMLNRKKGLACPVGMLVL